MNDVTKTEVNMGYVQGFVNLIAQALVAATELPKQIEAMQTDLTTLHADLDRTKQRNIELDTLTGDLRRQRDEAEQALSQAKTDLSITANKFNDIEDRLNASNNELTSVRKQLEQAKKDRDDYGLKHMAAEDRANEAEAKLKKLREALGMPDPKPEPIPLVLDVAKQPEPTFGNAPQAMPEPTSPKRIYDGEPGFNNLSHTTEKFEVGKGWYREVQDMPF